MAEAPQRRAPSAGPGLPFSVTRYYLDLIGEGPEDPLRRQCIPREEEFAVRPEEVEDPLDEEPRQPVPNLVHRYADRVLFRASDECALYCRHCFRRFFSGGRRGAFRPEEAEEAARYIGAHPEVRECILSGGDPLTLSFSRLEQLIETLRAARPDILLRIATRIPAVAPAAIQPQLVALLQRAAPLFVITQFNHSRELTRESARALAALIDVGIPVLNQSVLLRGVNDSTEELARLFQGLTALRVKPYYLFQGDLAAGTSHLRVPLSKGLELVRELRRRISGLAMPVYALDLPGGGGKIPLTEDYLIERRDGFYRFRSPDGGVHSYPDEED